MSTKIGRNEPCPCSSGKKYKQCHGAPGAAFEGKGDAVEQPDVAARALAWLESRHGPALRETFERLLYEELWPQDGPDPEDVDDEAWEAIVTNCNEWLLAEGEIAIAGELRSINEVVDEARALRLSNAQRGWLQQLSARPLRLYRLVEARAGEGLLLRDELDAAAEPLRVVERTAQRTLEPGRLLGARVLAIGAQLEFSGPLYMFRQSDEARVLAAVAAAAGDTADPDRQGDAALEMMACWLEGLLDVRHPQLVVDAATGEPLSFITDHYRVVGMKRLAALLDAHPELAAKEGQGWVRRETATDGSQRPRLVIERGPLENRLALTARTRRLADEGRSWFEALAGALAVHVERTVEAPRAPPAGSQVG